MKNSLKQDRFLYQWCSGRGSKPSFSYSFSLELPLIAPVIEIQGLYCSSSSFWWNDGLWARSYQGLYIRRTTIFVFSFCIGLVIQLNVSALWVLKHHYITKRIRELLSGNSRFLIYNSLNQLLYYIIQKKVALSWLNLRKLWT